MENEMLAELVNKAKAGDNDAFEVLYREFYADVYFTCIKLIGNSSDAEDITQDTFVEAFTNLGTLQQPHSFRSWLGRIAANKSINFLKKMNRVTLKDNEELDAAEDFDESEVSFEDKVIQEDVARTISAIIMKLSEDQRNIIFLFYYHNLSIKEIAELYGCSENTIKSRLRYARLFIKKEIEKMEDEGYKLRCIAVLPFLFAIFKGQRNIISVSVPNNFSAGTNINAVRAGRKVIKLSKKAKIAIVGVAAAVVVGGGAAAVVMSGCGNSGDENSTAAQTSAVSSAAADENSKPADSDGSENAVNDSNAEVSAADFEYEVYDDHVEITKYTGDDVNVTIPSQIEAKPVTAIGKRAFTQSKDVETVIIPDNVTTIGDAVFTSCGKLKKVTIADSVTEIGGNVFSGCKSLEELTLPDSVTTIGEKVCYRCTALKEVKLSESLTIIPKKAFSECSTLENITIPDSVTSIESKAFEKCDSLTLHGGSVAEQYAKDNNINYAANDN